MINSVVSESEEMSRELALGELGREAVPVGGAGERAIDQQGSSSSSSSSSGGGKGSDGKLAGDVRTGSAGEKRPRSEATLSAREDDDANAGGGGGAGAGATLSTEDEIAHIMKKKRKEKQAAKRAAREADFVPLDSYDWASRTLW
jgi:hypothetical protein